MTKTLQTRSEGRILAIELTNFCNLRCSHCPQGKVKVPYGFISRETLLQCLEYCEGYTELNWRGESLLHPQLVEFIKLAKDRQPTLNLGIHTNGLLLTKDLFQKLVDNGLNWLHISLHTLESCEIYKQVLEWKEELSANIHVYAEVDTTQEELIALSSGLSTDMFQKYHIANWGGFLTQYRPLHKDPHTHANSCMWVKENKFLVAWDGRVNACCWDFELLHTLGHVKDFAKITHQPPYKLCSSCLWVIRKPEEEKTILKGNCKPPQLLETYKCYNLVEYDNCFYGCHLALGHLDLRDKDDRKKLGVVRGETLEQVKKIIDQLVRVDSPE